MGNTLMNRTRVQHNHVIKTQRDLAIHSNTLKSNIQTCTGNTAASIVVECLSITHKINKVHKICLARLH